MTCEREEEKIKEYMRTTVGFKRIDNVVRAAVVESCLRRGNKPLAKSDVSMLYAAGCMLYEVGDYAGALVPFEKALFARQKAAPESMETADTLFMIGECHACTDHMLEPGCRIV